MIKNRLREIRMREHMMSQKDFAKFLGITPTNYSMIERGESYPKFEKLFEICEKLDKDMMEIWYRE